MRNLPRIRLAVAALALGGAVLAASGCQTRPTPSPQAAPEATSLFVRNVSPFEINVFALPTADTKPVWLTSVPSGASRTVALHWSDLRANGGLVVRAQVVGSSKTWTSGALVIDEGIVAVLDLTADASRAPRGSVLRGVTVQAFGAAMR